MYVLARLIETRFWGAAREGMQELYTDTCKQLDNTHLEFGGLGGAIFKCVFFLSVFTEGLGLTSPKVCFRLKGRDKSENDQPSR